MELGTHMAAEIAEQPGCLSSQAERYEAELMTLRDSEFDLVLLVARGSSDHAALYARYLIETTLRIPVALAAPSVLTRYGVEVHYPRCLAIGISQSGAAPDVAEVLESVRAQGHLTLGVTNTPDSRITRSAQLTLCLGVGAELSVAATKTYTASLLALYQMVRALGGDLPEVSTPHEAWLEVCLNQANQALAAVVQNPILFSLGRGFSFPTANETALKLMECALLPCKAYSLADFEHGPKAIATEGSAAIAYVDIPASLEQQGCHVIRAPNAPVPEPLRPIWEVVFGQYLSLQAARFRNVDPDHPPGLTKVTRTL